MADPIYNMDAFLTLAEVSIALTGFAGVISVFQRRDPQTWSPERRHRLGGMLRNSLSASFFAFFPTLVDSRGLSVPSG